MTDPVIALTVLVLVVAVVPLLPDVLRGAVTRMGRVLAATCRRHAVTVAVLAASLVRPPNATAAVQPPILRMPLPPAASVAPDPGSRSAAPVRVATRTDRYVVQPGDSLWAITARHLPAAPGAEPSDRDIDRGWRRLYERNRAVVGADPDRIFPGQQLIIPEEW